jgi:hypothetical protein
VVSFQPSLRDWVVLSNTTQDLRPGLSSAVPAGLNLSILPLTNGLNSVPSLPCPLGAASLGFGVEFLKSHQVNFTVFST